MDIKGININDVNMMSNNPQVKCNADNKSANKTKKS